MKAPQSKTPYPVLVFLSELYNGLAYLLFGAAVIVPIIFMFLEGFNTEHIYIMIGLLISGLFCLGTSEGIKIALDIEEHLFKIRENTEKN
jgi:hypothetical protein